MEAIKTINLTKKYNDVVAVDNLNLTINHGELFSLLGVNGAGKTTTIKMLTTLIKPSDGEAYLYGNSINQDENKIKSFIGISPQETAVAANLTVKENLELICQIYSFPKNKTKEKIEELSKDFSFNNILNKKASKLSGGVQRKLSLAMALISEPKVLFLDEPTLGLDVIARSDLWDMINKLKGKITIILTTHYMEEAESLSDRIGIMRDGKLLVTGTVKELLEISKEDKFENAFISIVKEKNI